jgi:hypothetical protein
MCFLLALPNQREVGREETVGRFRVVCFVSLLSGLCQGVCRRVMAHVWAVTRSWTG